jgi:uncharacterized iron-regulated membrane protein
MTHAVLVALTILGITGLVSLIIYRAVMRWVEVDSLPRSLRGRVRWWNRHSSCVLVVSLLLAVLGVAGLIGL